MIDYEKENCFFKYYKNFMEKEKNMNHEEFADHIKKPEFSQALCYFFIDIAESPLYRELFGEAEKVSLKKDNKYGYYELSYDISNKISEENHSFNISMDHLYTPSEYEYDDDLLIKDIGDFEEVDLSKTPNQNACKILNNLIKANQNNEYYKAIKENTSVLELVEKSNFKTYNQEENPFSRLAQYSSCIGLNYMDTQTPFLRKEIEEHKAITLESPLGPLAYLHFKSSYRKEDPENTYFLSSIGVIPPLRQKGISKKLYELADKNLGFNSETLIYRTSPGTLAPKQFTDSVPEITKGHKALYLHSELSNLDFNRIKGFNELNRKKQINKLKKINKDFIEKTKFSENNIKLNEIKTKLLDNFENNIEKEIKKQKNQFDINNS